MKFLDVEAPEQAVTVSFLHEHVTIEIDVDGDSVSMRVMDSRTHGGENAYTWDEQHFTAPRAQPDGAQEDEPDE